MSVAFVGADGENVDAVVCAFECKGAMPPGNLIAQPWGHWGVPGCGLGQVISLSSSEQFML